MKTYKITFTIRPHGGDGDDNNNRQPVEITSIELESHDANTVIFDNYDARLNGWVIGGRFVHRKYLEDIEVVEVV